MSIKMAKKEQKPVLKSDQDLRRLRKTDVLFENEEETYGGP